MSVLNEYRVLDLTDEKGLFCSRLLSDMGAEVIRIHQPGAPAARVPENAGKKSITLDICQPKGRDLFLQLVRKADVLVESFPPGYLGSRKLDYQALSSINARLIVASISPFGQTGPKRDNKTSALVSSAAGGQAYVCGEPGQPPLKPPGPQAYYTAGLFAANGILLALLNRRHSGRGQFLDISIHECVAGTLDHVLVRFFYERQIARRQGGLYWNNSFRIFPCLDGYVLLSWSRDWETLVEWLDSEGRAGDLAEPRWRDETERQSKAAHIVEVLSKWALTHTSDELVETGQLMHFPWARVASIADVVQSPQLIEREYFVQGVDPATGKKYKVPGAPVKMSASPWRVSADIPQADQHNREIFKTRLGLTDREIASLRREGII
jgi:crotonobetainyl-CoA:carnitine CoA-transferase CaiB-like acyl-CoA transferase